MAASQITSASGLRRLQFFVLDSDGVPNGDQSGADGYDGVRLEGVSGVSPTIPDVQPISHIGDDRVFAQDFLPPNTAPSMTINTAKSNLTADATLTDTKVQTIGETKVGGFLTDKQGSEVDVLMLYYRQAIDTDASSAGFGTREWQVWMWPKVRIIPKGAGADQGAADQNQYNVIPTAARQFPWEVSFSEADNGFTESFGLRFTGENPPVLERWTGDGALATFNLTWTPVSTDKFSAWENGTPLTVSSVDTANKTVTFSTTPANAAKVIGWYETSDGIG